MSELHDRLEKLARRGTPRGADAVLAAAGRGADEGVIAGVEGDATVDDARDLASVHVLDVTNVEPINLELAPSRRKRHRFGALVALGGVAATVFVGVLAVGSFVGNGGGSDSPEGAVRQLADAVSHSDPLAAADVLAPDEVGSLQGTINAATRRAQELAVVQTASAPLSGLDLSVANLDLSTTSLGAGYAKVTVTSGTVAARTDKPRFSPLMQKVLADSGDNSTEADLATLAQRSNLPTFVVTVQENGHWYVSAAYTALEYVREVNGLPAADFGSGVKATATLGADTPDDAVSQAVHALADNDWAKLISLAPPDEIPVYDYRAALEQLASNNDAHTSFTVDSLTTKSTVSGNTAKVVLDASGTTDSGKWSIAGSCLTLPDSWETVQQATGSASSGDLVESTAPADGTNPPCGLDELLPFFGAPTADASTAPITVVQESGRWFVAPVGTVLDLVNDEVTGVTQRDIYTLLNVPQLLPPDGALTLGKPVTVSETATGDGLYPDASLGVYTFAGHQGESLLGLATSTGPTPRGFPEGFSPAEARVFTPDGKELDTAGGMLEGQALQLPADGTYTFVIQPLFGNGVTFTIYDAAQAPAAAKHPPFPTGIGSCTFSVGGGETCSSASASTVPSG